MKMEKHIVSRADLQTDTLYDMDWHFAISPDGRGCYFYTSRLEAEEDLGEGYKVVFCDEIADF